MCTTPNGRRAWTGWEPLYRLHTPRGPDGTSQTKLFKSNGEETITAADGTITTVLEGPDPRFGMQSPIPSTLTITTPSGLTATTTTTRGATLADPGELMSLTALNDTVTVNGEV